MSHLRGVDLLAIACGVLCALGYVGAVIAWIIWHFTDGKKSQ